MNGICKFCFVNFALQQRYGGFVTCFRLVNMPFLFVVLYIIGIFSIKSTVAGVLLTIFVIKLDGDSNKLSDKHTFC